jgi:hypothetical protein
MNRPQIDAEVLVELSHSKKRPYTQIGTVTALCGDKVMVTFESPATAWFPGYGPHPDYTEKVDWVWVGLGALR